MPTRSAMDRERFHTDRLRWRAQTLGYVGGSALLLLAAAWIVFGLTGATWLIIASVVVLAFQDKIPIQAVLRVRGARPVAVYEAPHLQATVRELARRAGLTEAPALYYVPRRQPEAFTVSSGGQAAIAVSRGLLDVLDPDELAGVLAHEVSHVRAGDTRLLSLVQSMRQLTGTVVLFGLLEAVLSVLGFLPRVSPFVPLLLVVPGMSVAVAMAVSRTREFDADLGAAALVGDPRPLARALWKLERLNEGLLGLLGVRLETLVPRSMHTHPPTRERVDRLLALLPSPARLQLGVPRQRRLVLP
jgi:heat shock protein HtpX